MALSHPQSISLTESLDKLRALTQIDVQQKWYSCTSDLSMDLLADSIFLNGSTIELNDKRYITWSAGHQVMWLGQRFVVPHNLQGYPLAGLALRLELTWWAEDAKIFVNGELVQQGDLFDSSARVLLSSAVVPGEEIKVMLRLVSPGHDIGALMRSQCIYESTDSIDPGFVADELTILKNYIEAFEPEKLDTLGTLLSYINWNVVSDPNKFTRSLSQLRQTLLLNTQSSDIIASTQNSKLKTQNSIKMLGHAHLDMAWLWTVSETWDVAQRTFESVLSLQQEFPDLTFCHSTPALYSWIEQHRPDLFTTIKQHINAGRWEIVGGMWVEPELNLIDGESIIRQILYAQYYVQEKFGQLTKVAWIPDSFGFTWQLPQILKQGGIDYFVTQKLHWNDTTKFPYGVFWWQSPDGSQVLGLLSPPNVAGVMDTNPITMTSYAINWKIQTQLNDVFWLPGVGDHGGGPTRDMLEVAKRWQQSPFFPELKFTTALNYLQTIEKAEDSSTNSPSKSPIIPIWNDELYLEFHRGSYTTHADQKRLNRHCEKLLYQAELFASLATIITNIPYPKTQLEDAWKKVLFNQFHDILPGTSIPEVFVEANQAWQEVEEVSSKLLETSLNAIASQIILPPPPQPNAQPIIIFNPLNWNRSEVVSICLPEATETAWEIYNMSGEKLPSQRTEPSTLLFLAKDIPSIGYHLFWLCETDETLTENTFNPKSKIQNPKSNQDFILENEFLRVVVNLETGDLSSIFDKMQQREVLSGAGNQLQAFQDSGQYWDAWNIDPNYTQHPLPPTQLLGIEWVEYGRLRSRIRVVRQLGESKFYQDYILDSESPILKIATVADWQERHVLLKVAFPLNLNTDYATYEIPCGAIQRTTQPQTPEEQAKWEVPSLRWADLTDFTLPILNFELHPTSESKTQSNSTNNSKIQNPKSKIQNGYGVSLLNDCKYGYDAQPSQLRLTLLRSSTWPDPDADRGIHHFTYAIYPHSNSWQSARTVHRGYELNLPLQVLLFSPIHTNCSKHLPPVGQLLDLQAENLILIAFKQAETVLPPLPTSEWILRCYECHGESTDLSLKSDLSLSVVHPVNLLEQPVSFSEELPDQKTLRITPWKIASFAVTKI
ncbi:MAG TPA: alpha-mannosidase [Cyanobacteria bacterium UBA11162]|nr:alpha-mannosidase [Cyanobacteria bacterium UBA11162]